MTSMLSDFEQAKKYCRGLAFDSENNLFLADYITHRFHMMSAVLIQQFQ